MADPVSAKDLAVLRTAKMAVDEGLIANEEFQMIKTAFTKAQMIKAGLDAGFIREEDYMQARNSFLQSLDFQVQESSNAPHAPPPVYGNSATMVRQPSQQQQQQQPPPMIRSSTMQASYGNGHGNNGQSRQPSSPAAAAAAPPPPPPGGLMRPPPPIQPAASMNRNTAPQAAMPQGNSGQAEGTIPIPANLARVGRAGVADGKKSMSGIGVHDTCINIFNHIKTRSAFKWVSYKIDDAGSMVIVDQLGASNSTYHQFLSTLPSSECRYAVYDYAFSNNDTGQVNQKLVFVHWAPSGSSIKSKMMYASTKEFIKGFLEGVGAELQADDVDELTETEMVNKISSSMARK